MRATAVQRWACCGRSQIRCLQTATLSTTAVQTGHSTMMVSSRASATGNVTLGCGKVYGTGFAAAHDPGFVDATCFSGRTPTALRCHKARLRCRITFSLKLLDMLCCRLWWLSERADHVQTWRYICMLISSPHALWTKQSNSCFSCSLSPPPPASEQNITPGSGSACLLCGGGCCSITWYVYTARPS